MTKSADTITDPRDQPETANGFVFRDYTGSALLEAVDRALAGYAQRTTWQQLQTRGMQQDFSWHRAAVAYTDLYREICNDRSA